jgi:hypothetical protein
MTSKLTVLLQLVGFIVQVILAINPAQLPLKWQGIFIAIVAIAQAVQATIAHNYTPTGVNISAGSTIETAEGKKNIAR